MEHLQTGRKGLVNCSSVIFRGPGRVEVETGAVERPGQGQVLVRAEASAISAGTEMLVFRGEIPAGMEIDSTLQSLRSGGYPLKYGYCLTGRILELGAGVPSEWQDAPVFAFHPHESHFVAECSDLIRLPMQMSADNGVFLPNLETAVNLLQDAQPLIGERVLVLGQGIVGLLLTALLLRYPLSRLVTVEPLELRREASLRMGADLSVAPKDLQEDDFDLCFEVSGQPDSLNLAIASTGFSGRVVIGSWYGSKRAEIDLGGSFHRSRIRLISSQVSTIDPLLSGRWSKSRRLGLALALAAQLQPQSLITHRFAVQDAAAAYALLDTSPERSIQVIFSYGD